MKTQFPFPLGSSVVQPKIAWYVVSKQSTVVLVFTTLSLLFIDIATEYMSNLSLVTNWLSNLTVSSVENTLVEAGRMLLWIAGEIPT